MPDDQQPDRTPEGPVPPVPGGSERAGSAGGGSSPTGAGRRRRRRRGLRMAALVLAGLVLAGGAGAGYLYYRLNANIHSVDIDHALGARRPAKLGNGAMDILVLGSDSRSGVNRRYGHDSGTARSDTTMIVHLNRGTPPRAWSASPATP